MANPTMTTVNIKLKIKIRICGHLEIPLESPSWFARLVRYTAHSIPNKKIKTENGVDWIILLPDLVTQRIPNIKTVNNIWIKIILANNLVNPPL